MASSPSLSATLLPSRRWAYFYLSTGLLCQERISSNIGMIVLIARCREKISWKWSLASALSSWRRLSSPLSSPAEMYRCCRHRHGVTMFITITIIISNLILYSRLFCHHLVSVTTHSLRVWWLLSCRPCQSPPWTPPSGRTGQTPCTSTPAQTSTNQSSTAYQGTMRQWRSISLPS